MSKLDYLGKQLCCSAFRGSVLQRYEYPSTETSEQSFILMNTNTSWPQKQTFHVGLKKGWQSEDGNLVFYSRHLLFQMNLIQARQRDRLTSWVSSNKKTSLGPKQPFCVFSHLRKTTQGNYFCGKHFFHN